MDKHRLANGSLDPAPANPPWRLVGLAATGGLVTGALLWVLTLLVSMSTIGGDGWSLSGNGALIVPIIGLPLALGVGIAILARRLGRGRRGWELGLASLTLLFGLLAGFYGAAFIFG